MAYSVTGEYRGKKDPLFSAGLKGITTGQKSSNTFIRNKLKHDVETSLGKYKSMEAKKNVKSSSEQETGPLLVTGLRLKQPRVITRRDMGLAENTVNGSKIAMAIKEPTMLFESLFESEVMTKIEKLIEEFTSKSKDSSSIPKAPAGAIKAPDARVKYTIKDLNRNMTNITKTQMEQKIQKQKLASKIDSGTEMTAREHTLGITAPISSTNASARQQAAENHRMALEAKQQEQEQQNG